MLDDGRIVVEVVEIRGDKVRIGIEAPDGCRVDREEIHIIRQREAAGPAAGEGPSDGR